MMNQTNMLSFQISLYVLSFLSPRDLLRASQTCKTWRVMCEDNIMWRDKCKEAQIEDFQVRIQTKLDLCGLVT